MELMLKEVNDERRVRTDPHHAYMPIPKPLEPHRLPPGSAGSFRPLGLRKVLGNFVRFEYSVNLLLAQNSVVHWSARRQAMAIAAMTSVPPSKEDIDLARTDNCLRRWHVAGGPVAGPRPGARHNEPPSSARR